MFKYSDKAESRDNISEPKRRWWGRTPASSTRTGTAHGILAFPHTVLAYTVLPLHPTPPSHTSQLLPKKHVDFLIMNIGIHLYNSCSYSDPKLSHTACIRKM